MPRSVLRRCRNNCGMTLGPTGPGVWTVCYHHNSWTTAVAGFKENVLAPAGETVSLHTVLKQYSLRRMRVIDLGHAC
jgi:hypothetical protein